MALEIGDVGSFSATVTEADTAHALGNPGVTVLATPRLAEFCDNAAVEASRTRGQETRRLRIDIRHLAATPVGSRVAITATLSEISDQRLVFEIAGCDSHREIVSGRVERLR